MCALKRYNLQRYRQTILTTCENSDDKLNTPVILSLPVTGATDQGQRPPTMLGMMLKLDIITAAAFESRYCRSSYVSHAYDVVMVARRVIRTKTDPPIQENLQRGTQIRSPMDKFSSRQTTQIHRRCIIFANTVCGVTGIFSYIRNSYARQILL